MALYQYKIYDEGDQEGGRAPKSGWVDEDGNIYPGTPPSSEIYGTAASVKKYGAYGPFDGQIQPDGQPHWSPEGLAEQNAITGRRQRANKELQTAGWMAVGSAALGAMAGSGVFDQIAAQATAGTSYSTGGVQYAGGAGTTGTLSDVAIGAGDAEAIAAEKAAEAAATGGGLGGITAGDVAAGGSVAGGLGALASAGGEDQVGSDWATGQSTGPTGGFLPVDPQTGQILPNMQAGSTDVGGVNSVNQGGLASTIGKLLFGNGGTGANGLAPGIINALTGSSPNTANSSPLMNALAGALGAYGSNNASNTIADAYKYGIDQANPFASQRAGYQAQLAGMPVNPSNPYGTELQNQISNPNLFQNAYRTEAEKRIADPNLFKNPYGTTLEGMISNPNLFNNEYLQKLSAKTSDPNLYNNPFTTAAEGMANNPASMTNQYGVEAGRMISDPSYFLNNPMMSNLRDVTMNATQRQLAAQLGGDQGSIGARDTLNKQLMAAQTPTAMNYFQNLSSSDIGARNAANSYFQSLLSGGNQANANTTNYLNTLSNTGQGINQNLSQYMGTLNNANLGTNSNMSSYLNNLFGASNQANQNTNQYLGTLSNANSNANNTGLGYYQAMQTNAGANVSPNTAGQLAGQGGQAVAGQNQQTYGNLGGILNQLGNGQNSPLGYLYNTIFNS